MKSKLKEIVRAMSRFSCVHRGGCAVFAYLMAVELKKRDIPFSIRCGYQYGKHKNLNSIHFKNPVDSEEWLEFGVSLDHVFLQVGEYFFDSNEVIYIDVCPPTFHRDRVYDGEFSLEQLRVFADEEWNPRFDRRQIPEMRSTLEAICAEIFC